MVSVAAHLLVLTALLWRGSAVLAPGTGRPGARGGGGGGGRPSVHFFTLPAYAPPAPIEMPAAPPRALALADVPPPEPIRLELERIRLPRDEVAKSVRAGAGPGTGTGPGQGTGAGGGQGSGVGTAAGADAGPGTGEEGSYILLASPRWAILPPANPPAAVRGRPLRVQFWVSAEGRVTRVEVDPPIKDAAYRREFMERMQGYLFTPAITRDGRRVASVYPMTLTP